MIGGKRQVSEVKMLRCVCSVEDVERLVKGDWDHCEQ